MSSEPTRNRHFIRIAVVLALIAALAVIAVQFFSGPSSDIAAPATGTNVWTCSMHPQVRLPKPGKCPICSMPLVPVAPAATGGKPAARRITSYRSTMMPGETSPVPRKDSMGMDMVPVFEAEGSTLTLSEHSRAMAGVETAPVGRRKLSREIRAVGKVQYNESALSTITARVPASPTGGTHCATNMPRPLLSLDLILITPPCRDRASCLQDTGLLIPRRA